MEQLRGLKGYYRQLERSLNCPRPQRLYFLSQASLMVEDYLQGNPKATPEEVCAFLGDPKDLARAFLESLDPDLLRQYQTKRKNAKWYLILFSAVSILFLCILSFYLLNRPMKMQVADTVTIYGSEEKS